MTSKKTNPQIRLTMTSARWKAASAVYCANVLCPDLNEAGKRKLANAILGHGIAVVEHADRDHVQAVFGNRNMLRIKRNEVVWCEQYTRWETALGAGVNFTARRV